MKKFFIYLFIALILISAATPVWASSFGESLNKTAVGANLSQKSDITLVAAYIVQVLLGLVGVIFLILIIYGGVRYMTSQGDSKKVEAAKKIISSAVIGLIIVVLAYAIGYFVTMLLTSTIH